MARWIRDKSPGARAVYVSCVTCAKRVRLSETYMDLDGPSFTYWCEACRPLEARLTARCHCGSPTRLDCEQYHN